MHWHLAQGADGRKHLDLTWEAKGTGVNHDPVFKEGEQECGVLSLKNVCAQGQQLAEVWL